MPSKSKSFKTWVEADFNNWLNKNLNMSTSDFVPVGGATIMAGKVFNTPNGPVKLDQTTMFNVSVRDTGGKKVYKLTDMSQSTPGNLNKANFPHAIAASKHAGREYILPEEEYEKLVRPTSPQPPGGGMGGGTPGMGI